MAEEIKEILQEVELVGVYNKVPICFTHNQIKILYGYITNLQQEKEELKEIEKEHKNCTRKHWQQKCAEHYVNEMIYKSRCEKAVEYIKENYPTSTINYQDDKYKLINILNGSDEE